MAAKKLPTVGFIGAGRTASALACSLRDAGYRVVAIASRTRASAEHLAFITKALTRDAQSVADLADLVFITTPDDVIGSVAAGVAWRTDLQVVHTSGALTLEPLWPAKAAGAHVGSFHPIQTLLGAGQDSLEGVVFGVEAEGKLRDELWRMAQRLRGEAIDVPGPARALYHAAAVMSCGYVTSLLHDATIAWIRAGLNVDTGIRALTHMTATTANNVRNVGFDDALTGPIARGDADTVRAHMRAIACYAPEVMEGYATNGRRMAVLASETHRADVAFWNDLLSNPSLSTETKEKD